MQDYINLIKLVWDSFSVKVFLLKFDFNMISWVQSKFPWICIQKKYLFEKVCNNLEQKLKHGYHALLNLATENNKCEIRSISKCYRSSSVLVPDRKTIAAKLAVVPAAKKIQILY